MNSYLFSYGTLQKEEVQNALFGRILQGTNDTLRGYTLSTIEIRELSSPSASVHTSYLMATKSKKENDHINGIGFEIIEEELRIADEYETDAYKRIQVVLQSGKRAWVYVSPESI